MLCLSSVHLKEGRQKIEIDKEVTNKFTRTKKFHLIYSSNYTLNKWYNFATSCNTVTQEILDLGQTNYDGRSCSESRYYRMANETNKPAKSVKKKNNEQVTRPQ